MNYLNIMDKYHDLLVKYDGEILTTQEVKNIFGLNKNTNIIDTSLRKFRFLKYVDKKKRNKGERRGGISDLWQIIKNPTSQSTLTSNPTPFRVKL